MWGYAFQRGTQRGHGAIYAGGMMVKTRAFPRILGRSSTLNHCVILGKVSSCPTKSTCPRSRSSDLPDARSPLSEHSQHTVIAHHCFKTHIDDNPLGLNGAHNDRQPYQPSKSDRQHQAVFQGLLSRSQVRGRRSRHLSFPILVVSTRIASAEPAG